MFKIDELLKATNGRLICGDRRRRVRGISIDSRSLQSSEAFIAIKGDRFDGYDFIEEAIKKGATLVVAKNLKSKIQSLNQRVGNPKNISFIEVKDTTAALGDIARFQREKFDIPVIAVTGSCGKTTTKDMLSWVLSKKFKVLATVGTKNNHIGLPQTLLGLDSSYDLAALELGTNHFGEIEYLAKIIQPNIGVITNIGPSHLEYFKNLKGVFIEKCSLLRNLLDPAIAILNSDDRFFIGYSKRRLKKAFRFGIKNPSDFRASNVKMLNGRIEFLVNQKFKFTLKTLGRFNVYNALIAITIARILGLDYKDIAERLSTFKFPQNRLHPLEFNKIRFINDTYNSNPLSLKLALDCLNSFKITGRKIFVMGDMLELGNFKDLFHRLAGEQAAETCDVFLTVGKLSALAAKAARKKGLDLRKIFTCESNQEARDILFTKISPNPNDIVLIKGSRAMKMEEIFT